MEKSRKSNFELLRIISMLLIVVYHYVIYGGILNVGAYTINKLTSLFVYTSGRLGVNVFILLMGYFMINSRFKIKKVLKLMFQVFFYSVALAVLSVYRYKDSFEQTNMSPYYTPIMATVYWFITCYVATYIFSPFLNKLIKSLGKQNCEKLIILFTAVLVIIPFFNKYKFVTNFITWFLYMYTIGAYIREYNFEFKKPKTGKRIFLSYLVIAYITIIASIALNKYFDLGLDTGYFVDLYSPLTIIGAIGIFMWFKNMDIKDNKVINFFGKTSFAVYLLHDNVMYKNILWSLDCKTQLVEQSPIYEFLGHMIISVLGIYLVASLIETLRVYLLEKPLFKIKIFDKYFDKLDNWMNIE